MNVVQHSLKLRHSNVGSATTAHAAVRGDIGTWRCRKTAVGDEAAKLELGPGREWWYSVAAL